MVSMIMVFSCWVIFGVLCLWLMWGDSMISMFISLRFIMFSWNSCICLFRNIVVKIMVSSGVV